MLVVSVPLSAGKPGQSCTRKEKSLTINSVSPRLIVAGQTGAVQRAVTLSGKRKGSLAMFCCFAGHFLRKVRRNKDLRVGEERKVGGVAQALQPRHCNISCHSKRRNKVSAGRDEGDRREY